jgi:hypothetical protein
LEAEESVIGACLLSATACAAVSDLLEPKDFYRESHGTIFATVLALHRRGDPVDPILVAAELERLGALDKIGGQAKVAELAALTPSTSNVAHYAHLVLETARSRNLIHRTQVVQQAAANGGVALHPEMLDDLQRAIDQARSLPGEPALPQGPVFLTAHDFASRAFEPPEPLLGTADTTVLAAGGLGLLAGRPHTGKTTLLLDLICHLAAGKPWPPVDAEQASRAPTPWPCPRPLRIAMIENEGPIAMFQAKVQDKLERFPHSIREAGGLILIQTLNWGAFSFADRAVIDRARGELDEHEIDLVVGDPLASLGLEGVGSPAETLAFVQLLRPLGLGTHRAFLFLHHFRERAEKHDDELSRLSGAWGGHLDTLITLAASGRQDQARLAYPKLRWNKAETPPPIILGRVFNTRSFEALAEESDPGLLEPLLVKWFEEQRETDTPKKGWGTSTEIAKGVSRQRKMVEKALEGAPHLFTRCPEIVRAELKVRGNAKLWGLAAWIGGGSETAAAAEAQTELGDDDIPF